jgi:hypothetical protein
LIPFPLEPFGLHHRKVSRFFQVIFSGGLERKARDVDAERGLTSPNGLILMKLDRFRKALAHAGPALNTILRVDRDGFVSFDFINFAGTDLSTISTAVAFLLIDDRIHASKKKFKTLISKSETNPKFESQNLFQIISILNISACFEFRASSFEFIINRPVSFHRLILG